MSFDPREDYVINRKQYCLKDFHDFAGGFVIRPPYQRKTVWSQKKKQALMDSLFRKYYVPRLVLRRVRLSETKTVKEVIDGQQRINTLQQFFAGEFALPRSLSDFGLAGLKYGDLEVEKKLYISRLTLDADLILNIEEKDKPAHQQVATEIFWRLQQGESLNSMEVAHARLSSRVRNFLVKYADDITFDYERYRAVDNNPNKHKFFKIISRRNDRMEHLSLLGRMLLIERDGGYTDLNDAALQELIDSEQCENGIGDDSYETEKHAKTVLRNLNVYRELFKNDPMLKSGGKIQELKREYFILSFYILIRYLNAYYVVTPSVLEQFRRFFDEFYRRWRKHDDEDNDIVRFSDSRQQGARDLQERDMILRGCFFEFLAKNNTEIIGKDSQRAFNEAQRIEIYRAGKGICRACLADGKTEKNAIVSWSDYQADHIVSWINGGASSLENAQILCAFHNRLKGAA